MNIRIDEINVHGLGPIHEFTEEFEQINLIYGRNENGKTYLVEFLTKTLFRNTSGFNFRESNAVGKILISGISDNQLEFTGNEIQKLDEMLSEEKSGMPMNLAKLFVVKGADLNFNKQDESGISKTELRSFLSNENLLDRIQGNIQKTVRNAQLKNGLISGERRGELSRLMTLEKRIEQGECLRLRIDKDLAEVSPKIFKQQIKKLKSQIRQQETAKKHAAFVLSGKIQRRENDIQRMNDAGVDNLPSSNEGLDIYILERQKKWDQFNEIQKICQNYHWLDKAIRNHRSLVNDEVLRSERKFSKFAIILFAIGICAVLTGFISVYFNLTNIFVYFAMIGVVSLVISGIVIWQIFLNYQNDSSNGSKKAAAERILKSFSMRFGGETPDIAALEAKFEELKANYYRIDPLRKEIEEWDLKISEQKKIIRNSFAKLGLNSVDDAKWGNAIKKLIETKRDISDRLSDYKAQLLRLDIMESEYIPKYSGSEFDQTKLVALDNDLEKLKEQLDEEEHRLDLLKREIRAFVSNVELETWNELIGEFESFYANLQQELRSLKSEIAAGIIVNKVVENVRSQEDLDIQKKIQSAAISNPLKELTGRYDEVKLMNNSVLISNMYSTYELGDLSTGTKDQILLALRIGLAEAVLMQNSGFLILDDAFQHSDWERRELLVKSVFDLAQKGWQIIYFTMDDHIMSLFDRFGKTGYKKILLGS